MRRAPGTGIKHTHNRSDIGMQTQIFFLPDTVNFYNIEYQEVDVPSQSTGTYSCLNGNGHDPHPAILNFSNTVVAGLGTQAHAIDTVYTGHCGLAPPLIPGHDRFDIPYQFRVGSGVFKRFTVVRHQGTLAHDGTTLTIEKAGASATRQVGDPTSTF